MTAAQSLLVALDAAGVTVSAADGRLRWTAPMGTMTPAMLAELREHKADVLKILSGSTERASPCNVQADGEAVEERAAILEYDAGVPRVWAEGVARLVAGLPPPAGCSLQRWTQLSDDAAQFIADGRMCKAAALGWDVCDVFGAMPGRPVDRVDVQGLVWLLQGRPVIALDAHGATIATPSGGAVRIRRNAPTAPHLPIVTPACDRGTMEGHP